MALYMTTREAYFKSCTIKGTIDFIFGSARSLDGVELEVDGVLDGVD
jgi:pectin methylesterase-like acyl-CoA thioesterase